MKFLKLKKLVSIFTALALCLSFAGCNSAINDTSWILKSGEISVPAGIYISAVMQAMNEAESLIAEESGDDSGESSGESSAPPVYEQTVEGTDGNEWIKSKAMETIKKYIAVEEKFDELGLSLSAEDIDAVKSTVDFYWSYYSETYEANGVSKASFEKNYMNSFKSNELFKYFYEKGGVEEVSDDDLKKYYTENYYGFKLIEMSFLDSGNLELSEEQIGELKSLSDNYIERINAGENIDLIIDEYTSFVEQRDGTSSDVSSEVSSDVSSEVSSDASSEVSSDVSSEVSSDASSEVSSDVSSEGEDEEDDSEDEEIETDPNLVVIKKDSTSYPEELMEALSKAEYGTAFFVETEEEYFVAVLYDVLEDSRNFDADRENLLYDLKGDDYDEKVLSWANALTDLKYNESSIKRYIPKKIKLS